jgi:hypothetical protein
MSGELGSTAAAQHWATNKPLTSMRAATLMDRCS